MTMKDERTPDDTIEPPEELDDGIAFAYGEHSAEHSSPSVIDRIGAVTGHKPGVSLRDESSGGVSPLLKPLPAGNQREAGKYVIHGELGRGGVGSVHRGHDQDLGRDVAIKFLHEQYKHEPSVLHRFVEEAQIGGQLQHPGIVPVYDLGLVDGRPFFSMKLVKGHTLSKKLIERESPGHDLRSFLSIFEDVCQTLAYAHARGVVHRDLKPANIMIGAFGEVQVVDWGMGKVLKSGGIDDEKRAAEHRARSVIATTRSSGYGSQSVMGSVMGTPAYMPPEQARGDVEAMDERSDVFSLGAILCELLTGKPPYVGERDELIGMAAMAKLDDAHARLAACNAEEELVELATRCLMPAPAARPASAAVVAKAVHDHLAAAEARVHEARVEAAEAKVRAASLKRTQTLGIGLTVVIAAGLAASLWFWREASTAAENERTANLAAQASALAAEASADEARKNEELAESRAQENRHLLYVSDLQLALRLLDEEEGSAAEIDRILSRWIPSGEEDLRDFTWRHLWQRLHGDGRSSVVADDYGIGFLPDGRLAIRQANRFVAVTPGDASRRPEHLWEIPNSWMTDSVFTTRSPEGSKLALQLPEHLVIVDVATGDELLRIPQYVRGIPPTFGPRGRWMAYFTSPTETQVIDTGTGEILHAGLPFGDHRPSPLAGQNADLSPVEAIRSVGAIRSAALSPDGSRVLLAGIPFDPLGTQVSIFQIGSDAEPWTGSARASTIAACEWSPRGDTVAAGHRTGEVGIWECPSMNPRHTISAHGNHLTRIKYSRDGARLASATEEGAVALWDVDSGALLRRFRGHVEPVTELSFSPDGRFLASASLDGVVRFWDLEVTGEKSLVADYSSAPDLEIKRRGDALVLSHVGAALRRQPDAPQIGARLLAVRDHDEPDFTRLEGQSVKEASLLLRGAPGSSFSLRLQDWNAPSSRDVEVTRDVAGGSSANRCEFSPDGRWLAVAGGDTVIYDTDTWRPSLYRDERSTAVAFSPDGQVVALESLTSAAPEVHLYSLPDHRLLDVWPTGIGLLGLTFSPDGSFLAGGSGPAWFWSNAPDENYVKIWDVTRSVELPPLIHQGAVMGVQFTPDGRQLVSASQDRTVRLWNVENWSTVWIAQLEVSASSLEVLPDGSRLVAGGSDGSILVLDLRTGQQVLRFQAHDNRVMDLAFNADGLLASASWDQSVKLWNVDRGELLLTLRGHSAPVIGLSWSADTAHLCSADLGGTVHHWDASALDQIDRSPVFMASMFRHSSALRERSPREAQALLTRTVADQEELLGARHRSTIRSLQRLGEVSLDLGETARAVETLSTSFERWEGVGSELRHEFSASRLALAKAKLKLGAGAEAESLLRTLVSPSAWIGRGDQDEARIQLAEALRQRGRETDLEEAATLLAEAHDFLEVRRARIALYEQWDRPLELERERARLAFDRSDRASHKKHLHRVLELRPDDRETLRELGNEYALIRQWDEAAALFLRWAELEAEALSDGSDPSDSSPLALGYWEAAATAIACAGDRAHYTDFCNLLLDLVEDVAAEEDFSSAAWFTMFLPTEELERSRSYELLQSVFTDRPTPSITRTMAEYRMGKFASAARLGEEFLSGGNSWFSGGITHSILAGSHAALGDMERARQHLASAEGLLGAATWSDWRGAALAELICEEMRARIEENGR